MAHKYFLSKIEGNIATVTGSEAVHLSRVMRIKSEDSITLSDKNGFDYKAIAQQITENEITFSVLEKYKNPAEPTKQLVVYMALPKSDKLEFIVQKCCELGAVKLVPFVSEFCVAQKSKKEANKLERLQKISNEACKQSGRSIPLEVCSTLTFKEMLADLKQQETNLFFYEHATTPLQGLDLTQPQTVGLIIGSEGGFSQKECDILTEHEVTTLSLGKRILRCETAAVTAVSLTMFLLGEMT